MDGGRVRGHPVVAEDTTGHEPLARCVAGRVERFDFGAASGEVTVPVVFVHP